MYCRERGWKLKQCKKYAASISKSNLGIEARAINREKQEAEAMRKKAAWVAKEVGVGEREAGKFRCERDGSEGDWAVFFV